MGGIGKVFKSIAHIAMPLATMFIPGGGIFAMAGKLFGMATKISDALKPLAPKVFEQIDNKILNFHGIANKVMGKAAGFLQNFGKNMDATGDQMIKAFPQPLPQLIPNFHLPF